ncbi:MAG: ribose 5-phosphate isomerase B [Candidatus Omnitrophica bacterium]|nr:ribose 5-phosphate isomerase B [Candidatus Omnitrophota bacterium]
MRIAIGSDHRGYFLKGKLKNFLRSNKVPAIDVGTHSPKSCDYPLFAKRVAHLVSQARVDYGILICKTGIGSAIAANKIKNIRAALCYNIKAARFSRQHNNANILVLGSDFVSEDRAKRIVQEWLSTNFGGGRHERRLKQITNIEEE